MDRKVHDAVIRKLVDDGKVIEAGWMSMRITLLRDASQIQIDEMRKAFFAGAQHLFASIMGMLEPGAEPTAKDLERMTQIASELDRFVKELQS